MTGLAERIKGCLLGGAIGDALGAPVEFLRLAEIRAGGGVHGYLPAYGRAGGAITDDTQMTLFTAEGLIRSDNRLAEKGVTHEASIVHQAYLRWLRTQGDLDVAARTLDGWLIDQRVLWSQRAPGNTCLAALRSGRMGTIDEPLNDSKGCGGVMRVAPAGFLDGDVFQLAAELAAVTHGHPTGYLAAGAFAEMVAALAHGQSMPDAVDGARARLRHHPDGSETAAALEHAVRLAERGTPAPETIEQLGGGWVADEALAIAVLCALTATDVSAALQTAVTHSGDSDSTGSLTGNLLGTAFGADALPADLLDQLEARDVIEQVADDLAAHCANGRAGREGGDWDRYPGW